MAKARSISSAKNEYEAPLNHSVLKTGRTLHTHIPRFLLPKPDRKQELYNQRLHFRCGNKAKQELSCNVSSESSVNAIKIFAFWLHKNGVETKQRCNGGSGM